MFIQHNIMALNAYNNLNRANSMVAKSLERLSSGYRINRAADDPAGLAISEKMRAQITGLNRATQNAKDAISLVQTAEGNMTEIHSMLNRMADIATQASNGTYDNDNDRKNLQKEISALRDEINRISKTANFNGKKLLDGSLDPAKGGAGLGMQIGDTAEQRLAITVGSVADTAMGLEDIDVSTLEGARKAIGVIKKAINYVSGERATLGATLNRLEHTINNLTNTAQNITEAESRIRDTDMAKEMMNYTKQNIIAQVAQAMLAQANTQPQQVLQLLKSL